MTNFFNTVEHLRLTNGFFVVSNNKKQLKAKIMYEIEDVIADKTITIIGYEVSDKYGNRTLAISEDILIMEINSFYDFIHTMNHEQYIIRNCFFMNLDKGIHKEKAINLR